MGITLDLVHIVIAAMIGGVIASIFRQPLLIGYIVAGVFIGPHTSGVTIKDISTIERLAEIGVALLLFAIGLECSLRDLRRLSRITFIGAPLQIIFCSVFGYILTIGIGLDWKTGVWIGAITALSSTMVVLKSIASNVNVPPASSQIMLAILLVQDLAIVPMMLILPQITSAEISILNILVALSTSLGFLILIYILGTRLLPKFFSLIATSGSRELFLLALLAVVFGIGYATHAIGMSFALGAFIAGITLSETDFSHQALSDISGLRDLFGLLFFVSVGMLFDPSFFISNLNIVLFSSATIILSKALVVFIIIRALGYSIESALSTGLGLAQLGEFGFLISDAGAQNGSLSTNTHALIISITVVSMVITPAIIKLAPKITKLPAKNRIASVTKVEDSSSGVLKDHVIIVGGGSVGEYVGSVLDTLDVPFIILESNHSVVKRLRKRFKHVLFGDASQRLILDAVNASEAKLIIVTINADSHLTTLIKEARALKPSIKLVLRINDIDIADQIDDEENCEVVHAQREAGLEMIHQSLLSLGFNEGKIFMLLSELRGEGYNIAAFEHQAFKNRFTYGASRMLEFGWYSIVDAKDLHDRSLIELRLRETYGVSIIGIVRNDNFLAPPPAEDKLGSNDLLGIVGTSEQLRNCTEKLKLRTESL